MSTNYDGHVSIQNTREAIQECPSVDDVAFSECVSINTPTFALLLHNTVSTELFTLNLHSTPTPAYLKIHG